MLEQEWLNKRRKGLGGSDCAAICGVSPYKTPLQVWQDKRGLLQGDDIDNDAMFWGRTLEPVIRQRYSDVTKRPVRLPTEILHHEKYPYMLGNIDGFTDDPRGVEIKTAAYPKGWGTPGTDEIPLPYIFQTQHYMTITGFEVFDVPVLIGGRDFRIYEVPADKELQELIIEKEAEFWQLVQKGIPPEPRNYEDVLRRYRQSKAEMITATAEMETVLEELRQVREQLDAFGAREEEIKAKVMGEMKEADTLVALDGSVLATWKSAKGRTLLDAKAIQNDLPEVYAKYLKTGESSRRFLLK